MDFTQATQQVLWLAKFFDKVGLPIATPVMIHIDNNRSISTKLGQVTFNYIPSAENVTNLFTKPLL